MSLRNCVIAVSVFFFNDTHVIRDCKFLLSHVYFNKSISTLTTESLKNWIYRGLSGTTQ